MVRTSLRVGLLCCLAAVISMTAGPPSMRAEDTEKRIRIIYTNDTLGYLEPCGCGGRYEGGLARRATAIARLARFSPNCLALDSGNLARAGDTLGITCRLMARMKYCAVGVGEQDLAFRGEFLKQTAASGLMVIDSSQPKSKNVAPYLIRELGGVKIGIVSYGAASQGPAGAFQSAFQAARSLSDVLILLDQGGIATDQWLQAGNAPDIVIGGSPKGVIAEERVVGKTHIVPTSILGRHLGVADIRVLPSSSLDIEAQMLVIDKNTAEDKSVEKEIESFLLQPSRQAALMSRPQPYGKSKYTAPENCAKCHAAIYRDWRQTKHASALSTLIAANRVIPDCLPCHSEEYRRTLKTTRRPSPSRPTGIECATCHAAVIPHPSKGPAAKRKVDPKLCIDCHNPERSPDFEQKLYLDKVSHRGAHNRQNSGGRSPPEITCMPHQPGD